MPRNIDIRSLVKTLRKGFHLTQEQFAQRVGVTYSTVNHWENGRRKPQPFLVRRLLELEKELAEPTERPERPTSATAKRGVHE
jgi:DNA-binding transcriptional regulator YiaG